jgi:hypothetical protein
MDVEVLGFEVEDKTLSRGSGPLGSFDNIQAPHASNSSLLSRFRLSEAMSHQAVSDCYHVIYISPFAVGKVLQPLAAYRFVKDPIKAYTNWLYP